MLFRRLGIARRWVYGINALVVLFLLSLGIENGLSEAWPFVILLGVCIVQMFYPTPLGWGLILTAFTAYTIAVAVGMPRTPFDEYVVFLAAAALPTALLLWCRPSRSGGSVRRTTS